MTVDETLDRLERIGTRKSFVYHEDVLKFVDSERSKDPEMPYGVKRMLEDIETDVVNHMSNGRKTIRNEELRGIITRQRSYQ